MADLYFPFYESFAITYNAMPNDKAKAAYMQRLIDCAFNGVDCSTDPVPTDPDELYGHLAAITPIQTIFKSMRKVARMTNAANTRWGNVSDDQKQETAGEIVNNYSYMHAHKLHDALAADALCTDAVMHDPDKDKDKDNNKDKSIVEFSEFSEFPEKPKKSEPKPTAAHVEIIEHLNALTGSRFSPKTKATVRAINARMAEGYTVDDFKAVIEFKTREWLNDPKFSKYLQPDTLFAPSHFESYLMQASKGGFTDEFAEYNF